MLREIKKIVTRKEFMFVLLIFFLAVIGEFIYGCRMFRSSDLSDVISAYDATILSNNFNSPFGVFYGLLMPICVSIIASTLACEERRQRLLACIYTRENKRIYLRKQAEAVFIVAFCVVFVCLLVSLFLAVVTFPVQGYNTMSQTDYARLLAADDEFILDYMYRIHPYINLAIFILIRSLFAGAFAFMAYGCSFLGKWMRKITIILVPFVFLVGIQLLFQIMKRLILQEDIQLYFSTNILAMNHYGKIEVFPILWSLVMLIGIGGLIKGRRTEDVL